MSEDHEDFAVVKLTKVKSQKNQARIYIPLRFMRKLRWIAGADRVRFEIRGDWFVIRKYIPTELQT